MAFAADHKPMTRRARLLWAVGGLAYSLAGAGALYAATDLNDAFLIPATSFVAPVFLLLYGEQVAGLNAKFSDVLAGEQHPIIWPEMAAWGLLFGLLIWLIAGQRFFQRQRRLHWARLLTIFLVHLASAVLALVVMRFVATAVSERVG